MKLTRVLYKQHIGRQIKKLWYLQRDRKVTDSFSNTEKYLATLGFSVKDASEVVCPKQEFPKYSSLQNYIFSS